jgi:hypothetical protein
MRCKASRDERRACCAEGAVQSLGRGTYVVSRLESMNATSQHTHETVWSHAKR